MRLRKGILVVFEGIDGSGKSTQARRLLRRLRALGHEAVSFREPTRGKWGRRIKRMAKEAGSLTPEEELDLFVKDRKENVRKNLRPALAGKKVVILDRYYFSTIAYQGAKGIPPARIRRLNERFAVKPDLVFILDIEAGRGLGRIHHRKRKDLLFERERYLARVRRIFRGFRGRMFVHLDAGLPKDELSELIASRVLRLLQEWGRSPKGHLTLF
ncbi:MAG TPA: dTMP kinase [Candidatus Desulfaltia sp.]|nr:dTMP kinase [Candidatus Desulfaltia sp.]